MPGDFQDAVDRFEAASPWLGDVDLPAVVTLRSLARRIDQGDDVPAVLAQWGLAYRSLLKRAPRADGEPDELEQALRDAQQ